MGILLFLAWDVLSAAWEPVDSALGAVHDHSGGLGPMFGYGVLFAAGLAVGPLGLVGYEQYLNHRSRGIGPGTMSATGRPLAVAA